MIGIRVISTALTLGLALLLVSCPYNPQYGIIGTPKRFVNVSATYGQTPAEQYLVTVYTEVIPNDPDRMNHKDWYIKIELNYGDGSGWQDCTLAYNAVHEPYSFFDHCDFDHTYTNAGTYTILFRATFWNGVVVNTHADGTVASATVTVPRN
jgi:hypothetical protein